MTNDRQPSLPYFDILLQEMSAGGSELTQIFGEYTHWGYWSAPAMADGSIEDYKSASAALSRLVCDTANIGNGSQVLEVGCGFGGTIAALNDRFCDLELVGLNIDDRQLAIAIENIVPKNGNQVNFVCADACDLPFADRSFDVVLAIECIFHFPSRDRFFQEARRVLKPGGCLVLTDFIPREDFLPVYRLSGLVQDAIVAYTFGDVDIKFPLSAYRDLARKTGLMPTVENDITLNTLPTYSVLRYLCENRDNWLERFHYPAIAMAELAAQMGWMRYFLLSFAIADR